MKTITDTDKDFFCDIQAPCFQLLTKEEIEQIQSSRTQVLFRKGENLTKQGAFASYVLFVVSGFAKQYIEGEGTRCYNIRIVRPGEFLGLSSVFGPNTFEYSTAALTDAQAYLIEKEAIAKIIRQDGKFAFSIIKRYCEQNSLLFNTIHKLVYKHLKNFQELIYSLYYQEKIFPSLPVFQQKAPLNFSNCLRRTDSSV